VEVRKQPRFVVHLPGSFLGEHRTGEGVLVNISTDGCAVRSDARLQPGSFVELRIDLPDPEPPVEVEVAVVRWSRGDEFGLDFISLRPEECRRLSRFLRSPRWWRRVTGFVRQLRTGGRRDGEG